MMTASSPTPSLNLMAAATGSSESGVSPHLRAVGQGEFHALAIEVDSEHAAACGAGDLRPDLTEQPEPDDRDPVAETHLGTADALHRDGPERDERGVCCAESLGHGDCEVLRNADVLRVIGESRARRRRPCRPPRSASLPRPRR